MYYSFGWIAVVLVLFGAIAHGASFKCENATNDIENIICSDRRLSELDSVLSDAYQAALKLKGAEIKGSQQKWLKDVRNRCTDLACANKVYQQRIDFLDSASAGDDANAAALKLRESGHYTLAKELLLRRGERGDKSALYGLGIAFREKRDDIEAVLKEESAKGNMDAVFVLKVRYGIGGKSAVLYAAENGSSEAVEHLIGENYRHIEDDFSNNKSAELAYKYYLLGEKSNPNLKVLNENEVVGELSMCSQAGTLNVDQFLKARKLDRNESPWRQARLISKSEENPKLILQLVCMGGDIAFERGMAVREAYKAFIRNQRFEFDDCIYAQGKYSMGLCAGNSLKYY